MEKGKLYIYRGIPGSGKTTKAQRNFDVDFIFEADDYFWFEGPKGSGMGFYHFDGSLLPEAHRWCLWRTTEALRRGYNVAVANTFTRLWEMKPYLLLTDYVFVYRCTGNYQNIHNVPQDIVNTMIDRFEDYEGELFI